MEENHQPWDLYLGLTSTPTSLPKLSPGRQHPMAGWLLLLSPFWTIASAPGDFQLCCFSVSNSILCLSHINPVLPDSLDFRLTHRHTWSSHYCPHE